MTDENTIHARAEKLVSRLEQSYRSLRWRRTLSGILLAVTVSLALLSLLLVIEQHTYLPPEWKLASWIALLSLGFLSGWLVLRFQPWPSFTHFYQRFCEAYDQRDLENALDLYLDEPSRNARMNRLAITTSLERSDTKQIRSQLRTFTSRHVSHRTFRWTALLMIITLAGTSLLAIRSEGSFERVTHFWESYERPNPWEFAIAPGDTTLEYGSTFQPQIRFTGDTDLPDEVLLAIRTDIEESFRFRPMDLSAVGQHDPQHDPQRDSQSNRTFLSAPVELSNDATWYVVMDGYESERYRVDVQLRPRFEELTVKIEPPGYTGLESTTRTYPFAGIEAYGGSRVTLEGRLNKPVDELALRRADQEALHLEQHPDDSLRYAVQLTLTQRDTVRFSMKDGDGLSNANPFRIIMGLIPDEEPSVTILEPDSDLLLAEPDQLDIFYRASDDFGLTGAELHWELLRAFTADPQTGGMEVDTPDSGETAQISWNLLELDLRPRDQLTFWISVQDNDAFNGYKTATSQRIMLEVPSLSAWLDDVGEREQSVQSSLEEVAENHRQIEQEYNRLRERLASQEEAGWEEQQILDDMELQRREMDEVVNRLNQEFEEIRSEIENSDQVSEETRRSYQELRQVIQELDDPELQQAIEQLRQSLESMSAYEMQQALENFEFNEQTYRERLERTLELFKTLKMNSDLDRLAARYEEMAEKVVEESDGETARLEERQRQVREDTETVESQLEALDRQPPRHAEERLRQLKEESIAELHELQEQLDRLIAEAASREESGSDGEGRGEEMGDADTAEEGAGGDPSTGDDGSSEGAGEGSSEPGSADGSDESSSGEGGEAEAGSEESPGGQSADRESSDGSDGSGDSEEGSSSGDQQSGGSQAGSDGDSEQAPGSEDSDEPGSGEVGSDEEGSDERGSEMGPDESTAGEQISEQFQARAEQLRQARQQMSGQQVQINLMALQHALYTLIELSEVQEGLARQTGDIETGHSGYIDLARRQQNVLSQFSQVADTLYQVSREIPSLSEAINVKRAQVERSLTQSVRQMSGREQRAATLTSRESLGGINELASMLAESIDQLMDQQSGGAGGGMTMEQMLEQMQNMSADQQMMNDQLQQLINDAQGERLTQEQSERLEQLARRQNEIRRQLQQLQRSGALQQGDRMLSEMERMTEEMESAINDMRGGMTDPLMAERQQNILSRMLQAEEAMQQQGESEEYEGYQPEDYDMPLPPQLTLEEVEEEMRSRLQDPAYSPFRASYQQLIERYFERIRQVDTDGR